MTPLFNEGPILIALIVAIIAFSLWFAKTKVGKNFGPALTVIILALILHNIGVAPSWHDCYAPLVSYGVPIAISVMMLGVDVATLKKLVGQPLAAMLIAVLSVMIVAMISGIIFYDKVEEGWKVAGMFVGTYTGGSANLTAIAVALDTSNDVIAAANAADYVIGMPFILMAFLVPNLLKKTKWFKKAWPYQFTEEELLGDTDSEKPVGLLDPKEASILDITVLFSIGFAINWVSNWISSKVFGESFQSAASMLLLTTISLLVAQLPIVKRLRFKFDTGMLLCMGYLAIIGFMIDIPSFLQSTLSITIFCFCVVVGSMILHIVICRLFKIKFEYLWLSITAGVADGSTAALVAGGSGWNSLASIAVILGTLGMVVGNYVGVAVGYVIQAIAG